MARNAAPLLFNGPIETAARTITVLSSFAESGLSFDQLRLADFFVVFIGDIGGPIYLHPPVSMRAGAYNAREGSLIATLADLEDWNMAWADEDGIIKLSGPVPDFRTPYMSAIRASADYMVETANAGDGLEGLFARCSERTAELMADSAGMPSDENVLFSGLADIYASDIDRMEGLAEAARWFALHVQHGEDEFEFIAKAAETERTKTISLARGLEEVRSLQNTPIV